MPGAATAEIIFIAAMMVLILIVSFAAVYFFFRTYAKEKHHQASKSLAKNAESTVTADESENNLGSEIE